MLRRARPLLLLALLAPLPVRAQLVLDTTPATRPIHQQTRIYELIFLLRNSTVFARTSQTYAAVRELTQIGKPAVPALCAELDRSSNDGPLRTIPFTLRIIDDPRALPALLRALPKTHFHASDCGANLPDRELWQFIHDHHLSSPPAQEEYPEIDIPRPDSEIIDALKTLTHHSVSNAAHYLTAGDAPADIADATAARQKDIDAWKAWWTEHAHELLSPADLAATADPAAITFRYRLVTDAPVK